MWHVILEGRAAAAPSAHAAELIELIRAQVMFFPK